MQDKILSLLGLAIFLLGIGAVFGLMDNGHSINGFPGVFFVQSALTVAVCGVFVAWRYGARVVQSLRAEYLKRSFPNQPWMWRLDWSRRVSAVPKSTKNVTAWLAASWNLLVTPLAVAVLYNTTPAHIGFYSCWALVAAGIILFLYALYRVWYRVRLDYPELRLHTNPGRLGRGFECTLGVPGLGDGVRWSSEMVCIYSRIESVKVQARYFTQPVAEELWKQSFSPLAARSRRGAALALRYLIPSNAPVSGPYKQGQVRWVVRVQGRNKTGVLRFSHEYDIPVYRNALEPVRAVQTTSATVKGLALQQDTSLNAPGRKAAASPAPQAGVAYAANVDVPKMLGALKASGIRFTKGGVIYPDALWDHEPLIRLHDKINKTCWRALCGALAATALPLMFAPWYWSVPGVLVALAAGVGYAVAFYIRHHRYSVIFGTDGITRRSRLLSRQWEKTVPWSKIQTVVWKVSVGREGAQKLGGFRQLIINPDDQKTRMVLSPAIGNHDAAEALVKLTDSMARQFAAPPPTARRSS